MNGKCFSFKLHCISELPISQETQANIQKTFETFQWKFSYENELSDLYFLKIWFWLMYKLTGDSSLLTCPRAKQKRIADQRSGIFRVHETRFTPPKPSSNVATITLTMPIEYQHQWAEPSFWTWWIKEWITKQAIQHVFVVTERNQKYGVILEQIHMIQSELKYTTLTTEHREYISETPVNQIEAIYPTLFIKPARGVLIPVSNIAALHYQYHYTPRNKKTPLKTTQWSIQTKHNPTKVEISRRQANAILDTLSVVLPHLPKIRDSASK